MRSAISTACIAATWRSCERLLERAEAVGGPAIVFTFDPHPVRLLRPDQCPPPLTWTERKAELLAAQGVDWIVAYPTDEALLQLSAADFFQQIVRDALAAKALVEGPNFYFGHNREGTIERLAELSTAAGITLDVVPPVEIDGADRIQLARAGADSRRRGRASAQAAFRAVSDSRHGHARRRPRGENWLSDGESQRDRHAAAGARACMPVERSLADASYPAAINLGPSPTFGDAMVRVEVHSSDYDEPLYGQPLEVDFLARLRDIRPFDSPAALVEQLNRDVEQVKQLQIADPLRLRS